MGARWLIGRDFEVFIQIECSAFEQADRWNLKRLKDHQTKVNKIGIVFEADNGTIPAYLLYSLEGDCYRIDRFAVE